MDNYQNNNTATNCNKRSLNKENLQHKMMVVGCIAWYVFLIWLFVVIPTQYTMLSDHTQLFADTTWSLSD